MNLIVWLSNLRSQLPKLTLVKDVTVVMGNQACDLDSGVSALTLAFHLSILHPSKLILPLLNINRQEFPLKTELKYVLSKECIEEQHLIFRDDFELKNIEHLSLILVDHNVLPNEDKEMENRISEIIDHHFKETNHENATIETVGSCSSLVLRKILKESPEFADPSSLRMILSTILLDSVNLQQSAKRVTSLDIDMVAACEKILGPQPKDQIFSLVMKEKFRVDHLTVSQLCRRDLKIVSKDGVRIALSSVPMLSVSWSRLDNAVEESSQFMNDNNFSVLLVIGILIDNDVVQRDLIVVGDIKSNEFKKIVRALVENKDPDLSLEKDDCVENFLRYNQGNSAASRKQILPIVQMAL